jgi:hypothetical protein
MVDTTMNNFKTENPISDDWVFCFCNFVIVMRHLPVSFLQGLRPLHRTEYRK